MPAAALAAEPVGARAEAPVVRAPVQALVAPVTVVRVALVAEPPVAQVPLAEAVRPQQLAQLGTLLTCVRQIKIKR